MRKMNLLIEWEENLDSHYKVNYNLLVTSELFNIQGSLVFANLGYRLTLLPANASPIVIYLDSTDIDSAMIDSQRLIDNYINRIITQTSTLRSHLTETLNLYNTDLIRIKNSNGVVIGKISYKDRILNVSGVDKGYKFFKDKGLLDKLTGEIKQEVINLIK